MHVCAQRKIDYKLCYNQSLLVSWPSGLWHLPAKEEIRVNRVQKFESFAHRQLWLGDAVVVDKAPAHATIQ